MITTVTFNPALDINTQINHLQRSAVNRVTEHQRTVGGKGLNVAKVISLLGDSVNVTGLLGIDNQSYFEGYFRSPLLHDHLQRVAGETRENIKIIEDNKQVTELNFPGFKATEQAIQQVEQYLDHLPSGSDIVIAGSLPENFQSQRFVKVLQRVKQAKHCIYLDTSGEALKQGIRAQPYLIKPNIDELEAYVGHRLDGIESIKRCVYSLLSTGISEVLLSLGEEGVIWFNKSSIIQASAPKVAVVNTVGAGDTLLAAFIWAKSQSDEKYKSNEQILSFATAAASYAVSRCHLSSLSYSQLEALIKRVNIRILNW